MIEIDTIMLDQDGVLANFHHGVANAFGKPYDYNSEVFTTWNFWSHWGVSGSEVNRRCTAEMWESLPWMHDGKQLLDLVLSKFDLDQIYILTVPMRNPESHTGKTKWLVREVPKLRSRIITIGPDVSKAVLAKPNVLLIDDRDKNVDEFFVAGGQVIRVPRPWNKDREFANNTVEAVAGRLEIFNGRHTEEAPTVV